MATLNENEDKVAFREILVYNVKTLKKHSKIFSSKYFYNYICYSHYGEDGVLESDGVYAALPLRHGGVHVDGARLGAEPHGRQHRGHLLHLLFVSDLIIDVQQLCTILCISSQNLITLPRRRSRCPCWALTPRP